MSDTSDENDIAGRRGRHLRTESVDYRRVKQREVYGRSKAAVWRVVIMFTNVLQVGGRF